MTDADVPAMQRRIASLESVMRQLQDERAIHQVLSTYSRALDWLDDELLQGVFFDDAQIDYGFFRGTGKDFRPLLMQVERSVGRRWHFTSQVKIKLAGDIADVESYNFTIAGTSLASEAGGLLSHYYGYYVDRFERRNGAWAIARRKHLLVGVTNVPEAELVGPLASLNDIGATSPKHPDYRQLDRD